MSTKYFGSRIEPAYKESFIGYSFMQKMILGKGYDEALRAKTGLG